jgi:putative phage-type endonuclease
MDAHVDRIISKIIKIDPLKNIEKKSLINKVYKYAVISLEYPITKEFINSRISKLLTYQEQLEELKKVPILEQRTPEWHKARLNMITASNFAEAINQGKFGCQRDLMIKKIDVAYPMLAASDELSEMSIAIMAWGTMFEEVAQNIYSNRNNAEMHEFGLMGHTKESYIGASPDGVSSMGIMLEIKCPPKRKITGVVPEQYYLQIQGQLEVCDLEECDYLECKFIEYKSVNDFTNDQLIDSDSDYHQILTRDLQERGIIIKHRTNNELPFDYLYCPSQANTTDMLYWRDNAISKFDIDVEYQVLYWYLGQYSCQRVYRNKELWKECQSNLKYIWDKIMYYRDHTNKSKYLKEIRNNKKRKLFDFSEEEKEGLRGPQATPLFRTQPSIDSSDEKKEELQGAQAKPLFRTQPSINSSKGTKEELLGAQAKPLFRTQPSINSSKGTKEELLGAQAKPLFRTQPSL